MIDHAKLDAIAARVDAVSSRFNRFAKKAGRSLVKYSPAVAGAVASTKWIKNRLPPFPPNLAAEKAEIKRSINKVKQFTKKAGKSIKEEGRDLVGRGGPANERAWRSDDDAEGLRLYAAHGDVASYIANALRDARNK